MFEICTMCINYKAKWSILVHREYENVFHTFKDYFLPHDEPYTKSNR